MPKPIYAKVFEFVVNYRLLAIRTALFWIAFLLVAISHFPEFVPIIAIFGAVSVFIDVAFTSVHLGVTFGLLEFAKNFGFPMIPTPPDPEFIRSFEEKLRNELSKPDPDLGPDDEEEPKL
jgi:hypothetical protein